MNPPNNLALKQALFFAKWMWLLFLFKETGYHKSCVSDNLLQYLFFASFSMFMLNVDTEKYSM